MPLHGVMTSCVTKPLRCACALRRGGSSEAAPAKSKDAAQMKPRRHPSQMAGEGWRRSFSGATPASFSASQGRLAVKDTCLPWLAGEWGRRGGGGVPSCPPCCTAPMAQVISCHIDSTPLVACLNKCSGKKVLRIFRSHIYSSPFHRDRKTNCTVLTYSP